MNARTPHAQVQFNPRDLSKAQSLIILREVFGNRDNKYS